MKNKRFIVMGLGEFGRALAPELARLGGEVLAVDISPKKVESVRDQVTMAVVADIRDRAALQELITSTFDVAILAIGGSLEASIMATLHLKELAVREIYVEANNPDRAEVLRRVGADHVISPEQDLGMRLARRLSNPNLIDFLPITEGYGVIKVEAPYWTHEKSLIDLELRKRMNLTVIALHTGDGKDVVAPGANTVVHKGDQLTLVGRDSDLVRFKDRDE
jgi:trk system potassium uptake protein TrkA